MGVACSTRGRDEKGIKILVGKPEGTRPFGTPGCVRVYKKVSGLSR
jgi:hypothetical protein